MGPEVLGPAICKISHQQIFHSNCSKARKWSASTTKFKADKDLGSDTEQLTESCQQIKVIISEEHVSLVESATRQQSICKLWFEYRAEGIP